MGKQLNFILLGPDEALLLERIARTGRFELYRMVSRETLRPLQLPLKPANAAIDPFDLGLVIVPKEFQPRLKTEFIESAGQYVLDHANSEVIEFSRSQLIDGDTKRYGPKPRVPWVETGRLWYEGRADDGEPKSPRFLAWAELVFKEARAGLIQAEPGLFFGPEAHTAAKQSRVKFEPPAR